ncbi:MAG: sugar phosphate isomerase/epimerase family protein [Acidimicrobiales bacterium]|jgi:sugar phosphate isomerase/epimerase
MNVELGIFARIFTRPTADEVAAAVAAAGFGLVQLNLSCIGAPTIPPVGAAVDFAGIRSSFEAHGVRIWGLSCTYNLIHPDLAQRADYSARAEWLIGRAPELGARFVTLCSGTRDPDDMWRAHPANSSPEAWAELRSGLDRLLPAAEGAGVRLGIEPEPGNIVADAGRASELLAELGRDARFIGIVLDPANLVTPDTAFDQDRILRHAFASLGDETVCLHAKDVVATGAYAAAGLGKLDYELVFELHAALPVPVPVVIQDSSEADVPRTRQFLLSSASR